jgi:hypothetical protein
MPTIYLHHFFKYKKNPNLLLGKVPSADSQLINASYNDFKGGDVKKAPLTKGPMDHKFICLLFNWGTKIGK